MFLLLFVLSLVLHVFGGLNIVDYILFQLLELLCKLLCVLEAGCPDLS